MKRGYFGHGGLGALAAVSLAGMVSAAPATRDGQPRYRRVRPSLPASVNRHTGEPHEHKREIARRRRQAERARVRRWERAVADHPVRAQGSAQDGEPYGLTRSGRKVPLA